MAFVARKIAAVTRAQLLILTAAWLAGIYVNGFVAILPGESAGSILLDPPVELHVVLATLGAATSVVILALSWTYESRRVSVSALLATAAVVIAGDSGIAFVLGGGSDSGQSMIMAAAFITAMFLTFASIAGLRPDENMPGYVGRTTSRLAMWLCYASLALFYAVFVTGIYVNLYVAGPVYSLPIAKEAAAFASAESSAGFLGHEALGGALLLALVALAGALFRGGNDGTSRASVVPVLLVAYSAYVGSLNLTSPPTQAGSALVSMLSSAGLMAALVITMFLALRLRASLLPG